MVSRWLYECQDCETVRTGRVRSRTVRCAVCDGETRPLGEVSFER